MRTGWSVLIDVVVIIIFAIIGRASHAEVLSLAGIAQTAWPFLVAGVGASGLAFGVGRLQWWQEGVIVWLAAAVGGLLLRVVSGGTAAVPFIIVATLTLGLLLVGWRVIGRLATRGRRAAA
ncbi:MAG TPA: DUF3054 domain-containing protein [Propionibacteriaceae bacterium]|nr:DUF3054 domain-containing protein [Propionibacteriaceae bacterium]HPZ48914.1 DUF3054 domain-containing protein [Propionibacteriaceae bacterium]HQE31577.1 DUF3054 domain-containing protein [Propionibacteriaceae bacterium]